MRPFAMLFAAGLMTAAPGFQASAAAPPEAAARTKAAADDLTAWIEGYFAYGPGEVKVEEMPQVKVNGWRLYRAVKTIIGADARGSDQTFIALEDGGKSAIVGIVFADEDRAKDPRPIRVDADLDGLRARLKKAMRSGTRLSLDPAHDRKSWKALKIGTDTGYGHAEIPAFVKADDGSFLIAGRMWDRTRSVADQRRELIKLEGVPAQGPADARVTVVEYSDMQCGFCKKRTTDWEPLAAKLEKEGLKIRRYIKLFPLADHTWAFRAASAGVCFSQQSPDLFFRWKSQVYRRQLELDVAQVDNFALDFAMANGVPEAPFKGCYLQEKSITRVLHDLSEGYGVGVLSTPTYFIDGVRVAWIQDNAMEEYLRKTYMKGAGLPLPTPRPTPAAGK